jgi:hypothetical protein
MTTAQTYSQRCGGDDLENVLTDAFHESTIFKYEGHEAIKDRSMAVRNRVHELIAGTMFGVNFGLGGETMRFGFKDGSALLVTPQDDHFVFTAGRIQRSHEQ